MSISRVKKWFAGASAVAVTLAQTGTVFAANNYSDVPAGIWYEAAVDAFVDAGYLDASQPRFRGSERANRAEFVKLIVELNGGILSTPPSVPSFDDVLPGTWYYGYFEEAGKELWVQGDNNCYGSHPCNARPADNINRAEAAALIVRAFGLDASGAAPQFVDNPAGQWYTPFIQAAADNCVLQGDDSTRRVRPGDFMNRAEMVVMLNRVDQNLMYGEDCGENVSLEPMIEDVVATSATTIEVEFNMDIDETSLLDAANYMVSGDADIDVSSVDMINMSTVELTLAVAMTANGDYTLTVVDMMTDGGEIFSDSMNFRGYSPIVQGDGILEVSLSAGNPVGDTVPKGANGVVMLSLDLSATCDDNVSIRHVTVLKEGFGAEGDVDGIYAMVDGARVSRKRTVDTQSQTADVRFTSPLMIPACGTKTVDIVADFSTTAETAGEHNLAVELASDVQSNAQEVDGNFPLRGETFRVASVTSGTVTIEYRSVTPTQVEVGDEDVVVGKFEVSLNSVEDQTLYSMTLENNGTGKDGDITNVRIQRTDGTVLTNTAASFVNDYVTLVFDPPFTILEGDRITLEVVADVVGGAGDTVQLRFEETSDVFAVGSLYGFGRNGQLYGSQVSISTSTTAAVVTIDAGQLTVEIDGPVQQSYTRTDNDAVLALVRFQNGENEPIDIRQMFVAIQGQTSTGAGLSANNSSSYDAVNEVLEDVEIRNRTTGETVSAVRLTSSGTFGTGTATNSTFQIYRFDDFVIEGEEEWDFRVDFLNNGAGNSPKSGDRFRVHICGEPQKILDSTDSLITNTSGCDFGGLISSSTSYQMQVEGLTTGDDVGDVRPRGTITGNFHRIATPGLTVAQTNIGSTDTAVKNSRNVQLVRFEARADEAEDILLNRLTFAATSGSLLNAQNYTLWVDTDGDTVVDTILEEGVASQSSLVTFDDLAGGGYVIPAEETVFFEVRARISSSLSSFDLLVQFSTGTTNYIEAEEADDGSSLSGIQTDGTCSSTCDITVTTTTGKNYELVDQGNLFVTKASEPVRSRQLLAGALGDAVLRLTFRAEHEDIDVTDLQINSSGSTAISVQSLDLYKEGETTAFASATPGACGSEDELDVNPGAGAAAIDAFCVSMENGQLVVPEGDDVDVIVYPRLKSDENGAVAGGDGTNGLVQLWLYNSGAQNSDATGTGTVRARGAQSSNNLTGNDADAVGEGEVFIGATTPGAGASVVGNKNDTVFSKFTSIANANPDADNTNVPTGVRPFGQFRFTAATNNNTSGGRNEATLSGIIFNVVATNVALDTTGFFVYNKADQTVKHHCQPFNSAGTAQITTSASGSFVVFCEHLLSSGSGINTAVDSGQSSTFVLEANITNPDVVSAATSTLQASLQSFSNRANTSFGISNSHISWADMDSSTDAVFTWIEYPDTVINSTSYKS